MQKRLTIKKGIGKNLTFAKITIRYKQSHTLWKRTQKKMIYSFKSICQTITVKDKKICTKQGIMSLLYRQKKHNTVQTTEYAVGKRTGTKFFVFSANAKRLPSVKLP